MVDKKARFILKWKIYYKSEYFNSLAFDSYNEAVAYLSRVFEGLSIIYIIE